MLIGSPNQMEAIIAIFEKREPRYGDVGYVDQQLLVHALRSATGGNRAHGVNIHSRTDWLVSQVVYLKTLRLSASCLTLG